MADHTYDPDTTRFGSLSAGDTLWFKAGVYQQPIALDGAHGTKDRRIRLAGDGMAEITQGVSADDFRKESNCRAKLVQDSGRFPGLYPWIDEAQLILKNCSYVDLENLNFRDSWPTHIALINCQNIRIRDCVFLDGTFAIAASGPSTYGIEITKCTWHQDRVPGRIWREIPWWRIHSNRQDDFPPVEIDDDWRLFDGDFFRARQIRGGVTITECRVRQAFNAIHFFNTSKPSRQLSLDVQIFDNDFEEIRDNFLEPEYGASNWHFYNNRIKNVHKIYEFNVRWLRYFYIYGNTYWYDSVQGPPILDEHRGGGTFKLRKKAPRKEDYDGNAFAEKMVNVFHNSLSVRSDYLRKGHFAGLQHVNNAIRHANEFDPREYSGKTAKFFGNLSALPDHQDERFTTEWDKYKIIMDGDITNHPAWPDPSDKHSNQFRNAGYGIGQMARRGDPDFVSPFRGDLSLERGSPCIGKSIAATMPTPDGGTFKLEAGRDVGAVQTNKPPIKGPTFTPMPPAKGTKTS